MRTIEGRTAVVTGGGSGIGRGSGLAFARRGARVVFADIDGARAADAAAEAVAVGGAAIGVACDVSVDADVAALHDATDDAFGVADLVMSNVGVLSIGRPEQIPLSEWARMVDVNFLSAIRVLHAFLPALLDRGSGNLVFTASNAGLLAYSDDRLPYACTKAATVALAEGLALSLRPRGIGVTCVCPGPVATNIIEQVTVSGDPVPIRAPDLAILSPDEVGEMVADAVVAGRFLLLTHPEVQEWLVERARDPEAFVAAQIAALAAGQGTGDAAG